MAKRLSIIGISLFFILGLFSLSFSEDITITTYYPSPYGSYAEIRAQRMAIGPNYYGSSYCWGSGCANIIVDTNTNLVVEGKVGIGTYNPGAPLHIETPAGAITEGLRLSFPGGVAANTGVSINWQNSGISLGKIESGWDNAFFNYIGFSTFKSGVGVTEKMRIDKDGKVGIGITNPGSRLTVKGSGATAATSSLNITDSAGTSMLYARDDGNVGIGTTSPTSKLTVLGDGFVLGNSSGAKIKLSVLPSAFGDYTKLELDNDGNTQGFLQITRNDAVAMQIDNSTLRVDNRRILAFAPDNPATQDLLSVSLVGVRSDGSLPPGLTAREGDIAHFGAYGFLGYTGGKWVSLQGSASPISTYTCPFGGSSGPTCTTAKCGTNEIPIACASDPPGAGITTSWWWKMGWSWNQAQCACWSFYGTIGTCNLVCVKTQ